MPIDQPDRPSKDNLDLIGPINDINPFYLANANLFSFSLYHFIFSNAHPWLNVHTSTPCLPLRDVHRPSLKHVCSPVQVDLVSEVLQIDLTTPVLLKEREKYRKIPNLSPGLINIRKHFLAGLYSGGLYSGGLIFGLHFVSVPQYQDFKIHCYISLL